MKGITNSQERGEKEQKKQLNKITYCNPLPAKMQHHSLHGKKFQRTENHKGEIRYIPRNLLPLGSN